MNTLILIILLVCAALLARRTLAKTRAPVAASHVEERLAVAPEGSAYRRLSTTQRRSNQDVAKTPAATLDTCPAYLIVDKPHGQTADAMATTLAAMSGRGICTPRDG